MRLCRLLKHRKQNLALQVLHCFQPKACSLPQKTDIQGSQKAAAQAQESVQELIKGLSDVSKSVDDDVLDMSRTSFQESMNLKLKQLMDLKTKLKNANANAEATSRAKNRVLDIDEYGDYVDGSFKRSQENEAYDAMSEFDAGEAAKSAALNRQINIARANMMRKMVQNLMREMESLEEQQKELEEDIKEGDEVLVQLSELFKEVEPEAGVSERAQRSRKSCEGSEPENCRHTKELSYEKKAKQQMLNVELIDPVNTPQLTLVGNPVLAENSVKVMAATMAADMALQAKIPSPRETSTLV